MKTQGVACLLAILASAGANASAPSAVRLSGEDFHDARTRALGGKGGFPHGSAEDASASVSALDTSLATSWDSLGSLAAVTKAFEQVRDVRFLLEKDMPAFQRRITWLYPDDGCWARAASAELEYAELHYVAPSKIFAFGNLGVKTPNSPWGEVGWWYHVAPAISFQGTIYVLDPAVEPKRPLTLKEWLGLISGDDVAVSICSPGTYEPGSDCAAPNANDNNDGPKDEKDYLKDEWKRLVKLKRDPNQELGDNPPWGH